MPWFVYIAFKQLFPSGKWFSIFSLLAIIGVSLGVAILLVVNSVMSGFGHELRKKMIDTGGDIDVVGVDYFIENLDPVLEIIEKNEAVIATSPFATGVLVAQHENIPGLPLVRAVTLDKEKKIIPFDKFITLGSADVLDDEAVIISSGLARSLNATLTSKLEIYSPLMLSLAKEGEILLPRELHVYGIFESGLTNIDQNLMFVDLELMQDLYALGEGAHGISVKIQDPENVLSVVRELNDALPPGIVATPWMERFGDFIYIIQLEKHMMFFIVFCIVLVSSFSIAIVLTMSVMSKTAEIGILGAMGASRWHISWAFGLQGLILGITGTISGLALGFTLLSFRDQIVGTFIRLTDSAQAIQQFYMFVELPVHYTTKDILTIVFFSIAVSSLAGILPALKAGRLKSAEALRAE